ncbi:hypothetical protein HDV57DRAFT_505988 [Trichoderma longibrachiatum]
MPPTMSVSDLSAQCKDLFRQCRLLAKLDLSQAGLIENQSLIFNLWVYYDSPVFEKRGMIDWRIGTGHVLHSEVTGLLERLARALNQKVNDLRSGYMEQLTLIGEAPQGTSIDGTLNKLTRAAQAIDRYHELRQPLHAFKYVEYDSRTGENLMLQFGASVQTYLDETLNNVSQEIKNRLYTTICLRHQHFCLLKAKLHTTVRHQSNGEPAVSSSQPTTKTPHLMGNLSKKRARRASQQSQRPGKVHKGPAQTVPRSWTAMITRPSTNQLPQTETPDYLHETASTMLLTADLPPRLDIPHGCTENHCPYCCRTYPTDEFTEEKWPRHIVRDLMPFICVMESCPIPNAMFDSFEEWTQHMEQHHRQSGWVCRCGGNTFYFHDEGEYMRHMVYSHGVDPVEDWEALTEDNAELLPFRPLERCPFCDYYDNTVGCEDVNEHIARHLLSLAQLSLPEDFLPTKGHEGECTVEHDQASSDTRFQNYLRRRELSTSEDENMSDGGTPQSMEDDDLDSGTQDTVYSVAQDDPERLCRKNRV